ncbi:unnamed protein product [Ectocarpus sp. CCAP 1310/34]|nr:unnamed protein product [Ectocarpus sp. CCAP 1310/34]
MMRDSSGGDFAATVIPITRSLIFWECTEVRRWLEALQFGAQTLSAVFEKRVSGANLISMINSDRLGELGITRLTRAQLLWNLKAHRRRIDKGDQKAGTAVDPTVFLGVEERLKELEQGGGEGGGNASYRPYSDNPDSASQQLMVRAMPSPKRVGGGLPVQSEGAGGSGGDILDLMSMDIGGDGTGSSPERAPEDGSSANEGDVFLAIEAAPQPAPAPAAAAAATAAGAGGGTATQAKKKNKNKSAGKKTFNLIDFDEEGEEDGGAGEEGEGGDAEEEEEEEVAYSEGAMGPEATVFEVVFPPGHTPNILLEESQPGNKLTVKSFPKRADGSRGTAEADGKIEKGDFLLAVNSIRLEGLGFNDAIRVLTTQARLPAVTTVSPRAEAPEGSQSRDVVGERSQDRPFGRGC